MSETSSDSPSVRIHPISPSSSLSSALSEPHSEPTSDEQPDLGAFNAVLREWTHLQPPPRFPVQIRSATSSTTPTFQPSLNGSDIHSEHSRNTRISGLSAVSSFTRPPSSSAQPEGSTVWAQAPIASYLYSGTPSNDVDEDDENYEILVGEGEYTPNSIASTGLTVEIESETDFDDSNGRVESSPYPYPSESGTSGVSMPVPLQIEPNRIDSREMEHTEESSATSRERTSTVTTIRSLGDTSVQLQSQARASPTAPSMASAPRSRNPIPPRTISDSSIATSSSASALSLLSYEISEAASMPLVEDSSSISASADSGSSESASASMGLKTQRSIQTASSSSTASLGPHRPDASTISSTGSPLPNPYSPLPIPTSEPHLPRRSIQGGVWKQDLIVDDLGTPDQPPSETLLFPRERTHNFRPVVDDDEEDIQIERVAKHEPVPSSGYDRHAPPSSSHSQTFSHREPYIEDDADLDVDYPSQYAYSYGPTTRSFGPALTPRGIPSQPTANIMTNSLGYSKKLLMQESHLQRIQHTQHPSLVQPQSQSQYDSNQSNPNMYTTATLIHPTQQSSLPPSYSYTPRAPVATQYSSIYISQTNSLPSSTSQYSYPRDQAETETVRNSRGYPFSLLGLHALPDELPTISATNAGTSITTTSQIPQRAKLLRQMNVADSSNASFSDDNSTVHGGVEPTTRALDVDAEIESILLEQAVPSLGALDKVLDFLANERERAQNIALRDGVASSSVADADDAGSGDDGEGVDGEPAEGEDEWKNTIENETNQPKRKRRRKRPPRSHGTTAVGTTQLSDPNGDSIGADILPITPKEDATEHVVNAPVTPVTSPKRKRKSKSNTPSVSASVSSSLLSVPLGGDGLQTAAVVKAKEKEFLVPPALLSRSASKTRIKSSTTILRRPDELLTKGSAFSDNDDSDFDGGRTPTNFDISVGDTPGGSKLVVPINLNGKKGKRVGRREREKEKAKYDNASGVTVTTVSTVSVSADDNTFEFDEVEEEDDNEDDGAEPQEDDDEERGDDNDSLSNLSLLKPPRRKRERSRRRKGRETAYIHTAMSNTGSYRSIPGTPGQIQTFSEGQANDGNDHFTTDTGSKQSTAEDDDVFGLKANVIPEKRKRTRNKRLKPTVSVPNLKLDTNTIGSSISASVAASIASTTVEDRTQQAVLKATKGRVGATDLLGSHDVLDMDRNQLQNYLIASGSGIILMNSPPQPKNQPPPDSKRGRLLSLARQLRGLFPEQYEDLGRIIQRIEAPAAHGGKAKKVVSSDAKEDDGHLNISRPKRRRSRKGGHIRAVSDGTVPGGDVFDFDEEQEETQGVDAEMGHAPGVEEEQDDDVDPRGRPPKRGDVLVHVFIDHSNILIGLLSHLKRNQNNRKNAMNKTRSRPLPALISKATAAPRVTIQTDPASAFAAVKANSNRPLPIPSSGEKNARQAPVDVGPIPLPSFATVSHSLPTTSVLSTYMSSRDPVEHIDDLSGQRERETNSDGYEYPTKVDSDEYGADDLPSVINKIGKEKRVLKHLWHTALTLILERGRPITRRVVVTSSPLYQPMDTIERLGYELRVFIRVPDLGDGQDRERYRDKDKFSPGKSNGTSKSFQTSPAITSSSSGLSLSKKSHVRHVSGNTSTESGSGPGSGNASGGLHPYYGGGNSTSQTRVKFREQGVDELLQLKLHQALAATDVVPEGSTIVLATGDGNMGQFNEDGFLGPVRTALRRGWKVELYAWEDGLSRAWRREFGAGSDWGQKGLFRVIGMEQFANVLVEAVEHSTN